MTQKPLSPCRYPRCPNLATDHGYCSQHKKQAQQQQDSERGSSNDRGYNAHWRKVRLSVLIEEPLCRSCQSSGIIKAATDVDHIDGNVRNMSRDNLQPLCHACHSEKTARENGAFGNR